MGVESYAGFFLLQSERFVIVNVSVSAGGQVNVSGKWIIVSGNDIGLGLSDVWLVRKTSLNLLVVVSGLLGNCSILWNLGHFKFGLVGSVVRNWLAIESYWHFKLLLPVFSCRNV